MAKIKTKFDSLVKLKKLKIDEVENKLSQINSKINIKNQELDKMKNEISTFEYPKSGNFAIITQFKMMQKAMFNSLSEIQQQLNQLLKQKEIINEELKNVNLEYEKMKYLQLEEIKKYIKKIKEQEAKNMDEIALMLFKGN